MPEQGGGTDDEPVGASARGSHSSQDRPPPVHPAQSEDERQLPPEPGSTAPPVPQEPASAHEPELPVESVAPERPATPDQPAALEPVGPQSQGSFDDEPAPTTIGSVRRQERGVTTPRPPTVAEARHRDRVRKAREEADRYAAEQERAQEERAAKRRKVLMGSVAVVGLVSAVAVGYAVLNHDSGSEVSATCVRDGTNEVVPDNYCASGTSYGGGGGMFIYAGSPYRYYYGGNNGGVGSVARGGTIELPKGTTGKTKSGTSISRGGFGSSSHSGSGS